MTSLNEIESLCFTDMSFTYGVSLFIEMMLVFFNFHHVCVIDKLHFSIPFFRLLISVFQVRFKIFKECLPLHESSLKQVLKENYEGRKFKQELSGTQVRLLFVMWLWILVHLSYP